MRELRRVEVEGTTVRVVQGDLTKMAVDAIVNAANRHLKHGGGLAGAIVRAGGRVIQEESDRWVAAHGPLDPDTAAVTSAGALPARWVVHTAGPVYDPDSDQNEPLLRRATRAALVAAADVGARTVALPAISAGIYGYPLGDATRIIASEVVAFLRERPGTFTEVALVGFDDAAAEAFAAGLDAAV